MSVTRQPKLTFIGADIIQVDFKSTQPYSDSGDRKVNLNVVPRVFFPDDAPNEFKITMEVDVNVKKTFNLSIVCVGHFLLGEDVNDKERDSLVNINSAAILFPYVRSFITTFTANLGHVTGPLIIPPQFFKGKLEVIQIEED